MNCLCVFRAEAITATISRSRCFNIEKTAAHTESADINFYIQEMKVRYNGFKKLGILRPGTMIYVVKPLFVGLVSPSVMQHIKKKIKRGG